jgi:hypothetical protein
MLLTVSVLVPVLLIVSVAGAVAFTATFPKVRFPDRPMIFVGAAVPFWVRLCVCPPMVIVALRLLVEALAATDTVTVPLLLPLAGETVAQVWLEPAVQLVLEVTVMT